MNKGVVFAAATRALVQQGLTGAKAEGIVACTVALQAAEWSRVIARGAKGELSRVYIVVTHNGEPRELAVLYAPAEQDNIRHVMDFASQGPDEGEWLGGAEIKPTEPPQFGSYPVSVHEVGAEVKKAIAQLSR